MCKFGLRVVQKIKLMSVTDFFRKETFNLMLKMKKGSRMSEGHETIFGYVK